MLEKYIKCAVQKNKIFFRELIRSSSRQDDCGDSNKTSGNKSLSDGHLFGNEKVSLR